MLTPTVRAPFNGEQPGLPHLLQLSALAVVRDPNRISMGPKNRERGGVAFTVHSQYDKWIMMTRI